jgi:uncharacterized protein (DUF1330 family)
MGRGPVHDQWGDLKMAAFVVGRVTVHDPSWIEDYIPSVQALVGSHGGRYLVRSTELEQVEGEGEPPTVVVVIEFPSKEAAQGFYTSAEYKPYLEARQAGASTELILTEGL